MAGEWNRSADRTFRASCAEGTAQESSIQALADSPPPSSQGIAGWYPALARPLAPAAPMPFVPPKAPLTGAFRNAVATIRGAMLGMVVWIVLALRRLRLARPAAPQAPAPVSPRAPLPSSSEGQGSGSWPPFSEDANDPAAAACIRRGLHLTADQLLFVGDALELPILPLADPFGVTLLVSPPKRRIVAVMSSSLGTFYVGAHYNRADRRTFARLLDRATLVSADDGTLDAIGPDGARLGLASGAFFALIAALLDRRSSCLDAFVATDARGTAVTLDGRFLRAGDQSLDLHAPLEWRPFLFQERIGNAVAIYQGTWLRQTSTELVLVALLPSLGYAPYSDTLRGSDTDNTPRSINVDPPPPPGMRVAIERPFMGPLQSALRQSPHALSAPRRTTP